jgi:hypothetical protein
MKRKVKLLVLLGATAAIAATGAGWKWHGGHAPAQAKGTYKIAGWSWGDGGASQSSDQDQPARLPEQ